MTIQTHGPRSDERSADPGGGPGGTWTAAASSLRMTGWTPAHGEAARFVGEAFAVGAVLGFVTELARPVWEKRRG